MIGLGLQITTGVAPNEINQLLGALQSRSTYFENSAGTTEILTEFETCSF
jgi:hypothetical protein